MKMIHFQVNIIQGGQEFDKTTGLQTPYEHPAV